MGAGNCSLFYFPMNFIVQSYNDLLRYHSEIEILNFYLPGVKLNKKFRSPFRKDPIPSASVYLAKNGRLRFNDFMYNENLVGLVSLLYNISYREAEKKIIYDIRGNNPKTEVIQAQLVDISRIPTIIDPTYREWRPYDSKYWGQGGIPTSFLETAKVFPVNKMLFSSRNGSYTLKADKVAYCFNYHTSNGVILRKIYQPLNVGQKWLSNVNSEVFQLWGTLPKQGNKNLIISSSLKDSATVVCNTKIPSAAPNNESAWLPAVIVPKIKTRFDNIYVWFDNDAGGRRGAKRYEEKYGFKPIFIPHNLAKDQFEFRTKYGKREFIELTNYLINNRDRVG